MSHARIYYNTNGFAHHRLDDACRILRDLGYDGVSLTPDVHHLDPLRASAREVGAFRELLEQLALAITLESGARFLLDARRKHWPSLLTTDGHAMRQDSYRRHVDLCVELGSPLLSIWSGSREPDTPAGVAALGLLAERLKPVLEYASARAVVISFEPEPGMLIERVDQWKVLQELLAGIPLGLTLDTGHLAAVETESAARILEQCAGSTTLIQLDDSRTGVHEHLFFAQGDLDFASIFSVIARSYVGVPLSVELSRHGHDAVNIADKSIRYIRDGLAAALRSQSTPRSP